MENKIYLGDNKIIWVIFHGNQDENTITETMSEIDAVAKENGLPKKSTALAIDLSDYGETTINSRKAASEFMKNLSYNKAAIFGLNTYKKNIANFIIDATNKTDTIKCFDDKKEALAWLRAE